MTIVYLMQKTRDSPAGQKNICYVVTAPYQDKIGTEWEVPDSELETMAKVLNTVKEYAEDIVAGVHPALPAQRTVKAGIERLSPLPPDSEAYRRLASMGLRITYK